MKEIGTFGRGGNIAMRSVRVVVSEDRHRRGFNAMVQRYEEVDYPRHPWEVRGAVQWREIGDNEWFSTLEDAEKWSRDRLVAYRRPRMDPIIIQ